MAAHCSARFGHFFLLISQVILRLEDCLKNATRKICFEDEEPSAASARIFLLGLYESFKDQKIDKLSNQIRKLCFWRSPIADEGCIALAQLLKFGSIHYLELMENRLTSSCMDALSDAVAVCPLVSLSIDFNDLGDDGVTRLCCGLQLSKKLENLSLTYCNVGARGAAELATRVLPNVTSLKNLDLQGNFIRNAGLAALGSALADNTSLETLNVSDNSVEDHVETVAAFRDGVVQNTTLQSINLGGNLIGEDCAKMLAEMLASKSSISSFRVTTQLQSEVFNACFRDGGGKKKGKGGKKGKK
jgi:Ran GTPase-activating protein (RanGAP) involved in mRNA processing and transport